MSYTITTQRQKTMLARIGDEAARLIDDLRFLPFYRGVQIKLEKSGHADEWQKIIDTANSKDNPKRYFAKLCKMVRDGTYNFVTAVAKVAKSTLVYVADKIKRFNFSKKYEQYWLKQCGHFIATNGMAGFVELLELADRKKLDQRYFAKSVLNNMSPTRYFMNRKKEDK